MHSNSRPIAVFDSGAGGISVLRELIKLMPGENYLYYGDSANAPYGSKPAQQVQALTMAAADMLVKRGVKALVVACNTATVTTIAALRQQYPDLIILGIEPALKPAAERFPTGSIGIMATEVTLKEERVLQLMGQHPSARFFTIPAPGLVEFIEQDRLATPECTAFLRGLLQPYAGKLDALVLGCTHYPFAAAQISQILGTRTLLLDGGQGVARQTLRRLEAAGLLNPGPGSVQLESSNPDQRQLQLYIKLLQEGYHG